MTYPPKIYTLKQNQVHVAALVFSKPFVAVFYEFSKPLWLLVCCVCLLIVSTPFASKLGTCICMYMYVYTECVDIKYSLYMNPQLHIHVQWFPQTMVQ